MNTFILSLGLIAYGVVDFATTKEAGVIVTIPKEALQSVFEAGSQTLIKQLNKVTFSKCVETSGYEFCLSNGRFYDVDFPNLNITTIPNVGVKLSAKDAKIGMYGYLWSGIFKDHIGKIEVIPENIHISAIINITTSAEGVPGFIVEDCSASSSWVYVKFYGSWKSWFYNLFFRSQVAKGVKGFVRDHVCESLREQLESQSFQMVYGIEEWMQLDYHFTSKPSISNSSVEFFLKGEFKPTTTILESNYRIVTPALQRGHINGTIYIQVSEHTINTIGQTLQKSNKLKIDIDARDRRIPREYKKFFCTSFLAEFIPKLKSYPNRAIELSVESHKDPKVVMTEGGLNLILVADATFRVKHQPSELSELFILRISVNTSLSVGGMGNRITGKTTKFHYDLSVLDSSIGNISFTLLESPFVERLVNIVVMHGVDDVLQKGFPLPGSPYFLFDNLKVDMHKGNVNIAVDIAPPAHDNVLSKQRNVHELRLMTSYNSVEMVLSEVSDVDETKIDERRNGNKMQKVDAINVKNDGFIYVSSGQVDWNVLK